MTMAGMLIGTLNYMSPEQIAGQVVDNRSDIFAIGAVMYELLSQRQAFPGGLHSGIINRILHEQPAPDWRRLCPGLDDEVSRSFAARSRRIRRTAIRTWPRCDKDLQRARQQVDLGTDETVIVNPDPESETVAVERPPEKRSSHSGRRGTPREWLARLRATQLAAHLESAQRALDAGEFEVGDFRRRARAASGSRGSNRRRDHRPCPRRAGRTRGARAGQSRH